MPDIEVDGCMIHVEIDGQEHMPVLMLSNSLGSDLTMWNSQVAAFAQHFRVIRYDHRGHGKSDVTTGPFSIKRLSHDALAILDQLGIDRINWCGLSMGGMVGQWLGAHAPDRIDTLILSNTTCYYPDKRVWLERIEFVRKYGIAALAGSTMERWFSKEFREREPATIDRMTQMLLKTDVEGYASCCDAIREMDHRATLANIIAPTLVIAGRFDPATPIEMSEVICDQIRGAKLLALEASHLSNVEQPHAYANVVLEFLLNDVISNNATRLSLSHG
jgi:3-oxoadipate enol-lactonase